MLVSQVKLFQDGKVLTTWIETDSRVKPGVKISLRGEDGVWSVTEVYNSIDRDMINRAWHVGGL